MSKPVIDWDGLISKYEQLEARNETLKEKNRVLQQDYDFRGVTLARLEQLLREAQKIVGHSLKTP